MSSVFFLPFAPNTGKRRQPNIERDYGETLTLADSVQIFVVSMRYWPTWFLMNDMVTDQKRGTGLVGNSSTTKYSNR